MYNEYFDNYKISLEESVLVNNEEQIKDIINLYLNVYFDYNDSKEEWFNKIKKLAQTNGYATDMKEYKNEPNKFKGSIADISNYIRIALTSKTTTPDLYEIIKLLGKETTIHRLKKFYELLNV